MLSLVLISVPCLLISVDVHHGVSVIQIVTLFLCSKSPVVISVVRVLYV